MILIQRCWVCGSLATQHDPAMNEYCCEQHYVGDGR